MADFVVLQNELKKDLEQFNKLTGEKKSLVVVALLILFIISVIIGRSLAAKDGVKTTLPAASPTVTAPTTPPQPERITTTLSLSPSAQTLKIAQAQEITVNLASLPVTAIDIILTFDPKVLSVSDIQNGTLFDRVLLKKIESGSISYSAAILPENAETIKEGAVFSFMVTPLAPAVKSEITFNVAKTITALNGENTLGKTMNGMYSVVK